MSSGSGSEIIVILKPTSGTPELEKGKVKFYGHHTIQKVLTHLRKGLSLAPESPLFVFVGRLFAPSCDRELEQLAKLYGRQADPNSNTYKLILFYSTVEAWG